MKKAILTENAPAPIGPYSQAVEVNGVIYASGQIPVNPKTGEVSPLIEEQTKQSMENLKAIVEEAGLTMANVVKTTVFIKNMADFGKINEVYSQYFGEIPPARSCVEVACLPKNVQIEVEAIIAR